MKIKNLLALGVVVASGMGLVSCGGASEEGMGVGYFASPTVTAGSLKDIEVTVAAAHFDKKGVVTHVRFDCVQPKFTVNGTSVALNYAEGVNDVESKLELGIDYKMSIYVPSAVGEADAQIEAFAKYCSGKTVSEIKESLDSNGKPTDESITSSVTINMSGYAKALEKAYELKTKTDGKKIAATAKMGVGIKVSQGYGNPNEIIIDTAAALVDSGKVVYASIDALVYEVKVDGEVVTIDTTSKYYDSGEAYNKSKKVLGDSYGMGQYATKGEWHVQAAAIESEVVGLTAAEIASKTGSGAYSGASIGVSTISACIAEAVTYAEMEHVGPQA